MTAEEYRQRMIQAFHNADCDELIAICVLPTEKEFEHLEWLLKNHYKKEPCNDAISRQAAIDAVRAGVLSTATLYGRTEEGETARREIERLINTLPSVTCSEKPNRCEDAISRKEMIDIVDSYSESRSNVEDVTQDIISDIMVLPPVTTGMGFFVAD